MKSNNLYEMKPEDLSRDMIVSLSVREQGKEGTAHALVTWISSKQESPFRVTVVRPSPYNQEGVPAGMRRKIIPVFTSHEYRCPQGDGMRGKWSLSPQGASYTGRDLEKFSEVFGEEQDG